MDHDLKYIFFVKLYRSGYEMAKRSSTLNTLGASLCPKSWSWNRRSLWRPGASSTPRGPDSNPRSLSFRPSSSLSSPTDFQRVSQGLRSRLKSQPPSPPSGHFLSKMCRIFSSCPSFGIINHCPQLGPCQLLILFVVPTCAIQCGFDLSRSRGLCLYLGSQLGQEEKFF